MVAGEFSDEHGEITGAFMRYDVHHPFDLDHFDQLPGIEVQDRVCLVDSRGRELERYFVKIYSLGKAVSGPGAG